MDNNKTDDITSKLIFVLRKITKCRNLDSNYLDKLLINIKHDLGNSSENFLDLPQLLTWLSETLQSWRENSPSICEANFICQFVGILLTNEQGFEHLQKINALNDLLNYLQVDIHKNTSLKILLIKLLSDLLGHNSGFEWIKTSKQWKTVIGFYFSNSNLYIEREGLLFVKKLISKTQFDDTINEEILHEILVHLRKDTNTKDKHYCSEMVLSLRLLKEVLKVNMFLENTSNNLKLEKLFDIETFLKSTLENWNDENLLDAASQIYILFLVTKFKDKRQLLSLDHIPSDVLDVFYILHKRSLVESIIKLLKYCHTLWTELRNKYKCEMKVGVHFLLLQLIPLMICRKPPDTKLFDLYIQKLFNLTSTSTHKFGYTFRDLIRSQNNSRQKYWALKGVLLVIRNIEELNLDEAVVIFQTMAYGLEAFVPRHSCEQGPVSDEVCEKESCLCVEDASLLSGVLNALCILIEKFKINWTESLESLCLLRMTCSLLQNPELCTRAVVQTLLLVKLVILNFLSPNLALLLNNTEDSSFECLIPLLFKRMHDPNWEIRDSCIEVITAIAELAEFKYPAFQQLLIEKNFCSLVYDMVESDSESYVRASALRALTAMTKIESLNQFLMTLDLPSKVIKLLQSESEGIVRREAALLITEIYNSLDVQDEKLLNTLYEIMGYAAICDLHWEVKLNSLIFWEAVIHKTIADQGMIDGSFPKVTFSKEHKKIVNLTKEEVKLRLDKVLKKLSTVGCLFVLISTLNDDCDMPVIKKSAEILTDLVNILKRYEVIQPCEEPFNCDRIAMKRKNPNYSICEKKKTLNAVSKSIDLSVESTPDTNQSFNSDAVIEEIVSEMDINLLVSVYNQKEETDVLQKKLLIQELKPEAFLIHVQGFDSEKFLKEKQKWFSNVDVGLKSLLSDIFVDSNEETNMKDCY